MSDFQTSVNQANPIGVEGDFASTNPRASAYAGEGALVAGPEGVTVGRFCWIDADGRTVHNYGDGATAPDGFLNRSQGAALITGYLQSNSNVIPGGFPVTLQVQGDFLIEVRDNAATKGAAIYASYADGTAHVGAAPAGASATGSIGATFTATRNVADQLTVTAVTGLISVGDTISGTGVPAGTVITGQLSGTTGGAGTYTTSVDTTAAAATVTSFGDVLDVTAVASGTLKVGDAITGTGVPAGATIASQVSGSTGGVGVYTINTNASAYAASTTLTVAGGIVTKWKACKSDAVGNITAMSSWN